VSKRKRKPSSIAIQLTDRTLQDLVSITDYSIDVWGKKVAARYMGDFESALQRISDNPGLLRSEPNLHEYLYSYRVKKHLLVCDIQTTAIFVLTVLNASMDIPERLLELEPTLKLEVEMLHQQLAKSKKKK
jgi:plasmid stabilization system protein ParE|tara:strand:- start:2017 stop:2409 length:393 start_codon:yes stop_codon:yes gene_type:complete